MGFLSSILSRFIAQFASNHDACPERSFFGIPSWDKYLDKDADIGCAPTDFELNDIWLIAAAVLEGLLIIAGLVAVIFVMWSGFRYLTSQGDPQKTNSARSTLINAFVGLAITIVASASVSFVFGELLIRDEVTGLGEAPADATAIGTILNVAYGVAGGVAALMVVIGAFKYVTSAGDPQKAASALNTLIYALVGLTIVIFATLITGFVITSTT